MAALVYLMLGIGVVLRSWWPSRRVNGMGEGALEEQVDNPRWLRRDTTPEASPQTEGIGGGPAHAIIRQQVYKSVTALLVPPVC